MTDPRVLELLDFAAMEGIELPMSPEEIIAIEDAGGVIDLHTGEVLPGAADWLVELTVIGEATAVALDADEAEDVQP